MKDNNITIKVIVKSLFMPFFLCSCCHICFPKEEDPVHEQVDKQNDSPEHENEQNYSVEDLTKTLRPIVWEITDKQDWLSIRCVRVEGKGIEMVLKWKKK